MISEKYTLCYLNDITYALDYAHHTARSLGLPRSGGNYYQNLSGDQAIRVLSVYDERFGEIDALASRHDSLLQMYSCAWT
jgi:hypothetical protein